MASVSSGLRCIARLSLPTIKFSRWKGWPRRPRAVGFRVDAAEFPTQRRHQQMHLRREVPVQRANRDVGAVGDGAHLHRLIAAFGRDSHGGVKMRLRRSAVPPIELGLGKYRHFHDRARWCVGSATGVRVR